MNISSSKVLFRSQIQIIDKLMGSNSFPKCVKKSNSSNIDSNLNKTKPTINNEIDMKEK